jgi:MFS family permease
MRWLEQEMSETTFETEPSAAANLPIISNARRNYILFVLTLVCSLSYLDRQVLTILLEPIRKELSLNDTQIGLLTGVAFTLVFVTLGIPAARLADTWSRRNVIALAVGAWSLMTALCGFAQTFTQLLITRMGVGVGEAGGSAPSQAFVSDIFPKEMRSTAMAILFMSTAFGIGLGLVMGGLTLDRYGWRTAFIFAGIPGLIISPLVVLTVPEIRKGAADRASRATTAPPFGKTLRTLLSIPAFRYLVFASMITTFLGLGLSAWMPSFLVRSHGMSHTTIGANLALAFVIPHCIGVFVGGRLADVIGRRDLRWYFWIPAVATLISGAMVACAVIAPGKYVFWFLALSYLTQSLPAGLPVIIAQNLSPIAFRASASAVMMFMVVTVGLGLGPQAVGIISDLLRASTGEESLRIMLLLMTLLCIPAALFYYRASITYRADLAVAEARNKG